MRALARVTTVESSVQVRLILQELCVEQIDFSTSFLAELFDYRLKLVVVELDLVSLENHDCFLEALEDCLKLMAGFLLEFDFLQLLLDHGDLLSLKVAEPLVDIGVQHQTNEHHCQEACNCRKSLYLLEAYHSINDC